jgi:hypothetical protein
MCAKINTLAKINNLFLKNMYVYSSMFMISIINMGCVNLKKKNLSAACLLSKRSLKEV